jgi:hypothetical protein
MKVDASRFLQVIVVFESLAGFETQGLNGAHSFSGSPQELVAGGEFRGGRRFG